MEKPFKIDAETTQSTRINYDRDIIHIRPS